MINNKELLSTIQSYEDNVSDHMDSDAAQTRADLLDYYLGERYGNERDGYSSIVTREVYQSVENIKSDIAELFVADDETVRFEPEGPEDVEAAQQATDWVRYVFYRQNDGFSNIMDSLIDGLLQRQGVIKRWRAMEDKTTTHSFEDISQPAFEVLDSDPEIEITEFEEVLDELTGLNTYQGKMLRTVTESCTRVEVVPPEEFGIDRNATTVQEARFVRQRSQKSKSDLLEMGFEESKIEKATTSSGYSEYDSPERIARNFDTDDYDGDENYIGKMYDLHEVYIRVDRDEDGYDELLKVCKVGNIVLNIEEVDEIPFEIWTPIRMPHKLTGLCPADAAAPIQKVKSTLWRNQLDNQYNLNNGRPVVVEGQVDLDSVMSSKPGAPYLVKHPNAISFPSQPSFGAHTYNMMGVADQMLEANVGSTDNSLDPSILNGNTAAGAVSQVISKRQARIRLIAREFGEFLRKVFMGIYELEIAHADDKAIFRLDNKFVEVDPRTWNARKDVTVLVGLGNGSKTEQLFHMQQTMAAQQQMVAAGGLGVTVMPYQIVQLQEDMVRLYDKAAYGRYFTDPGVEFTGQSEGPSPDQQVMEAQMQATMAQIQIEQEKLAIEREELALKEQEFMLDVKKHEDENEFKVAELNLEARSERAVKIGN
jgi:hypothetical protein